MNTGELVSVIIPVYNTAEFLPGCLGSLAKQTYPFYEVILVDDCSDDGCKEICDDFCMTRPGTKVIHQPENRGMAEARAAGFEIAQGEFVTFVDSDDWVEADYLSIMVNNAEKHNADVVCCRAMEEFDTGAVLMKQTVFGLLDKEAIGRLLTTNLLFDASTYRPGCPLHIWGKLFRRKKIAHSLDAGFGLRYGEDTMVWVDIIANRTESLLCLDELLYHYVHHPGQITAVSLFRKVDLMLPYWDRLDEMFGGRLGDQLALRFWLFIKPNIYSNNYSPRISYKVRNSRAVRKHIWNNPEVPEEIRRSPHFFLLKHRLYLLDYVLYLFLALTPERIKSAFLGGRRQEQ